MLKVFGGTESLLTYPVTQTHPDLKPEDAERKGITRRLLRLSVGIEDTDDLMRTWNKLSINKGVPMGQYNFDQILDRTHTKSLKYDFAVKRGKPADVLPFWVADMDFEVPPELKQILLDRVNHGVFGYTESDDEYFEVLQNWFTTRF